MKPPSRVLLVLYTLIPLEVLVVAIIDFSLGNLTEGMRDLLFVAITMLPLGLALKRRREGA